METRKNSTARSEVLKEWTRRPHRPVERCGIRRGRPLHRVRLFRLCVGLMLIGACGIHSSIRAQDFILPSNDLSRMRWERAGVPLQPGVHATALPVVVADVNIEGIAGVDRDTTEYYYMVTRKLFGEHLIELDKNGLAMHADAVFDFRYGKELENDYGDNRDLYTNARGLALSAKIGRGVYLYTDFVETQRRFAAYIDRYVDTRGVVPGGARVKPFDKGAYDFAEANGYVAGSPAPWLHLMAGHYRQSVGAGHRSLLVSDDSFNYPFASYSLRPFGGKVQYRYTVALLQSLNRLPLGDAPESIFQRRYASRHYLSFKPTATWEIGLFESTVWSGYDEESGTRPFPGEALVPLPLIHVGRLGFTSATTHSIVGLNGAWQPAEVLRVYGQWVTGDDSFDHTGWQIGAQAFAIFDRVDLRAEYNSVHRSVYGLNHGEAAYAHYNQPLAHPLGSGFAEVYAEAIHYFTRWYGKVSYMQAREGLDLDGAPSTRTDLLRAEVAYVFNPFSNLEIYAGAADRRRELDSSTVNNRFYYFGLRTKLRTLTSDF